MMWDAVLWLYIVNATLLINHEMDSAYWHEWELFGMKGGVEGFLYIHVPLWIGLLYGLVALSRRETAGLVLSCLVAAAGIFAFCIHTYFLKKGNRQFSTFVSRCHLTGLLAVSLAQAPVTVYLMGI